jgi:hypothetical protein
MQESEQKAASEATGEGSEYIYRFNARGSLEMLTYVRPDSNGAGIGCQVDMSRLPAVAAGNLSIWQCR